MSSTVTIRFKLSSLMVKYSKIKKNKLIQSHITITMDRTGTWRSEKRCGRGSEKIREVRKRGRGEV